MKKYAVIGSHSAGKSTLCYEMASYLKKKNLNVDIVQERVRFSPFPFNDKMTEQTSLWTYHAQICRELEAEAKGFDTIICDRSPLDTFIYAEHFNLKSQNIDLARRSAINWLSTYEKIILIDSDIEPKEDGTRSMDINFQKSVNEIFLKKIEIIKQYLELNIETIKTSDIFKNNIDISQLLR